MFKAVIGSFPSPAAAHGAVGRLREAGFPGEHMALVVREPVGGADLADASLPATGNRIVAGLAILLAIIGVLIGIAVGYTTNSAATTTAGGGLTTGIVPYALIGAGGGLIVGILVGLLVAASARRAERRWRRAYARRQEALLAVATDAGSAAKARKILVDVGAFEVRGGGLSEGEEFAVRATPIAPDTYGGRPPVAAAPVAALAHTSDGPAADELDDHLLPPEKG